MNVIKPAIISEPKISVPNTYVGEKRHGLPVHQFYHAALHRNDGMEQKRRLAYATEIADFYRMQIVAEKNLGRGKTGGSVGFLETRHFFFFLFGLITTAKICKSGSRQNKSESHRAFCWFCLVPAQVSMAFPEGF